jgi:uncharacterized protein with HEPN domain
MNRRDIDIIEHIVRYCDEISDARMRFGDSPEALKADRHYINSVSMCILQIGELADKLSDEFKAEYNEQPWRKMIKMRGKAAHWYGTFDPELVWETIIDSIPDLSDYCNRILKKS